MGERGMFITFEGGEGSGKSTQISALSLLLESRGYDVLCLREPGGTAVGEQMRGILLNPGNTTLTSLSELLLYEAARAQLVSEVIEPALEGGKVVLCDRFTHSTLAYQGYGRGLDIGLIERLNDLATDGCVPDRTIFLDLNVDVGLERATREDADRMEEAGEDFHLRVRQGFLELARRDKRIRVVPTQELRVETACAVFHELADLFPTLSEADVAASYDGDTPFYFKGHES